MLDGFFYLVAQVALLLVLAAIIGILIGRYVWPRRTSSTGRAAALQVSEPLTGAEQALTQLERRLAVSEAEVQDLRTAVTTIEDRKETEMGRLESGAIEALDSLIATHQQRLTTLEAQLQAATSAARQHERDLEAERRRALRLQAALTDRDERAAALAAEVAERDERLEAMRRAVAPSE